jgi:GTP cyclohydrolase II
MIHSVLPVSQDRDQISVERAIAEFRSGRPVLIEDEDNVPLLAIGVEALDASLITSMIRTLATEARLILPGARLRRLGLNRSQPGTVALPVIDLARIEKLALRTEAKIDAPVAATSPLDEDALELARLALVLPALVVLAVPDISKLDPDVMRVSSHALRHYRTVHARALSIVSRAQVPLEHAPNSEFVVFRGGEGMRDQVAIIVGQPDLSKPVAVRLHSACLTGDLFGSLKCDCGDQLRDTVEWMAENEGGILLYLDQEGRGNGIANKMRAYRLQAQGFDTYDADEVLGFDLDQRRFDFAALMLTLLGVKEVRVMTNNPMKIAALREAGLVIVSDERVIGRKTAENRLYLASKRDRAGHLIDKEATQRLEGTQRLPASD